ncbi:hypothetical protein [Metabacillus arenae]|uniref:Uncharacterized protein n=1 Tax=Metabacillus arenae TaxID=2771434 RepID=A0A926NEY3_9BACI|nr:hypothetical protein [Metabacillus arenae]MBD1379243.1 hypothetical protein [Metabacillus arenae]
MSTTSESSPTETTNSDYEQKIDYSLEIKFQENIQINVTASQVYTLVI